jgi:hypothetical protein
LLEALFCKAFKTHHGVLDAYGTNLPSNLGYGLNEMSVLVQGRVAFTKELRVRTRQTNTALEILTMVSNSG